MSQRLIASMTVAISISVLSAVAQAQGLPFRLSDWRKQARKDVPNLETVQYSRLSRDGQERPIERVVRISERDCLNSLLRNYERSTGLSPKDLDRALRDRGIRDLHVRVVDVTDYAEYAPSPEVKVVGEGRDRALSISANLLGSTCDPISSDSITAHLVDTGVIRESDTERRRGGPRARPGRR